MKGSRRFEWVIVGGGIHGVHLATRLLAEVGVAPDRLRLLDPAPRLLESWRRCSGNTGMRHLRSPAVHHLDVDPWSLLDYSGTNRRGRGRGAGKGLFVQPYLRPSVELFADHCDDVIHRHGLAGLHLRGRARRIDLTGEHPLVELEDGRQLPTERVLLAVGGGRPRWPAWALERREQGLPVQHVFAPDFELDPEQWPHRVGVVGGGISAAQVALRLTEAGKQVHLVARHALRKHQFDSDPGWIGPKHMRRFQATRDLDQRRRMIDGARHAGSLPPDVYSALRRAIEAGRVVHLRGEQPPEEVEGVLLATGFEAARPGGSLVDDLVAKHDLPCAACGYPVVDAQLRWHPTVFVTGALAELEVGPIAKNIVGARQAADRIVQAAKAP